MPDIMTRIVDAFNEVIGGFSEPVAPPANTTAEQPEMVNPGLITILSILL
jgi:hypothetical protein